MPLSACAKEPPLVTGNFSQTEDGLWTNDLITVTVTPSESTETLYEVQLEFRNDTDFEVELFFSLSNGFGGVETYGHDGYWDDGNEGWIEASHLMYQGGSYYVPTKSISPHTSFRWTKKFRNGDFSYHDRTYRPLTAGTYRLRFLAVFDEDAKVEQREVWAITYVTVTPPWADGG